MTDDVTSPHLNNHHRDTLASILRHPTGHNIEWPDVLSLLEAVGTVVASSDGKFVVTLGDETETFTKPNHKDVDTQTIVNLRRMLTGAGFVSTPE
jgi:thiamine biosynthesis lipoprotein ApbE